jgi:branched-chain amino acid transport system ATP-binding protein
MSASGAPPALAARGLVAGYLPGIHILHGVSVDVQAGEVRCVLGPNGTGKSTLLKVLFGFLPPLEGAVSAGGHSLAGVTPHRMGAHGIVYLPQRPSVFPFLSVESNLRLGAWRFRRDRARVRARIDRAYEQFPVLRERRQQQAGTLSGGQQRQLEIARSLLTEPKVFLIDEPTASIEPRIAAQIYRLIQDLARDGKAVLLVDQNIKGALGVADHVYVMRTGTLFAEGPRADFADDVDTLVKSWLYTREPEVGHAALAPPSPGKRGKS